MIALFPHTGHVVTYASADFATISYLNTAIVAVHVGQTHWYSVAFFGGAMILT